VKVAGDRAPPRVASIPVGPERTPWPRSCLQASLRTIAGSGWRRWGTSRNRYDCRGACTWARS